MFPFDFHHCILRRPLLIYGSPERKADVNMMASLPRADFGGMMNSNGIQIRRDRNSSNTLASGRKFIRPKYLDSESVIATR